MAIMPGAIWKPLPGTSTTRIASYDILCWHTMVGSLTGTDSYFRAQAAGTNSHFGVGHDGTIYQWVDTTYRSGANLNGNYHIISVETADTGTGFTAWTGSNVPAWTPAQLEANARIAAWVQKTHGIPLTLIPDAKPGRKGNAYHRLGVPGYMVAGAEQWSSAQGKVCPGDRRIAQIPALLSRAQQLLGAPTTTGDVLDMDAATLKKLVYEVLMQDDVRERLGLGPVRPIYDTLTPGVVGVKNDGQVWALVRDTAARTAALQETVKALAAANGTDLDVDALLARVDQTVRAAIADSVVDVDVNVAGRTA
jgi:hypothetical protein